MIIVISPSKTLDFESQSNILPGNDPALITQSVKLAAALRKKNPRELAKLMDISPKLAELNALRFSEWKHPFDVTKTKPALSAFKGDVYEGLRAWELTESQIEFANQKLRILSGLYGLLKPNDQMMAYRLEMGTPLAVGKNKNLYEFWGDKITKELKIALKDSGSNVLINLASEEYFKSIDNKLLKARIVTPVFKEYKNGVLKFISFNGKKARGLMSRFIIDHRIEDPEQLKHFDYEGYGYMEQLSTGDRWVFAR